MPVMMSISKKLEYVFFSIKLFSPYGKTNPFLTNCRDHKLEYGHTFFTQSITDINFRLGISEKNFKKRIFLPSAKTSMRSGDSWRLRNRRLYSSSRSATRGTRLSANGS